jgi:hypothetical protein
MESPTPEPEPDREQLAVPAHLASYLAEVETWRLEALAYRAGRAVEDAG